MGSVYSGLMQGVGAAEKVFEFIDRQPTMVHDGSLAPDHLEGRVDFENVTFTYRTRPHTQVLQVREGLRPPHHHLPSSFPSSHLSRTSYRPGHGSAAKNTKSRVPPLLELGSSWGRQSVNKRIPGEVLGRQ